MKIQRQLKPGSAVSILKVFSDFEQIGAEFHRWVRNCGSELGLISSPAFTDFIERDFKFYSGWYYRLRKASKSIVPGFEPVLL